MALGVSDHYVWDAGSVVADPATDRRVSVHAAYAEEFADFERMAQDIKEIVASVSSAWPGVPWPYSHAIVFVGGGDEEFPMMANDGAEAAEGRTVRFIAAHELLHNYFPFYMGIDERRYPFMDEGWTTAFEYLFNLEDIGQEAADALFIDMRSGNLVAPHPGEEIPIIVPADATRGLIDGQRRLREAGIGLPGAQGVHGRRRVQDLPARVHRSLAREAPAALGHVQHLRRHVGPGTELVLPELVL